LEIIVNTRLLIKNKLDGIGRFSNETLKLITQQHPEHHFYFLFDRNFDDEFIFADNITPLVISPQARHPVLFYLWFEHSVAPLLNKIKPDLFLSPDGYLSLNSNVKQLPVFHDLNFIHYPNDVPWLVKKYYNYFFPRFAKKATRIATVSEFSKTDICKTFDIGFEKIDVVYNGASSIFKPVTDEVKIEIKKKYAGDCDYFLFVGSLHPRKNIVNLFTAFDTFKNNTNSIFKLIVVGSKYYWTTEMENCYNNLIHKNDVVFCGRIDDNELAKITASAYAVTYIPYFEGFGIPIIEAMQCGVPVITSNVTSMPEIASNAALLVNPLNTNEIALAMQKIVDDNCCRKQYIEKGIQRASVFTWQKTADLLWESIEKTIE